jgi:uncharacterized protein (TIGR02391 family)
MARPRTPAPQREPLLDANPLAATNRLRARIAEVDALNANAHQDPRFEIAERNIDDDIKEIFGEGSTEYERHGAHTIYRTDAAYSLSYEDDDEYQTKARRNGIAATKVMLQSLITRIDERSREALLGAITGFKVAPTPLDQKAIHTRIHDACSRQFKDQHYRDAILAAGIALVNYVKEKSGRFDLDGHPLMTTVFSVNNPVLKFNDLRDQTERNVQQGMMHLFAGAVLALRNPRAHSLDPDTTEYALEAISFISFLAKQLDTAQLDTTRRP